ncbi:MAG: c-type cytochrome [Chloroflexota bacterium]
MTVLSSLAVVFLAACQFAATESPAPNADGAAIYQTQDCGRCHGQSAQGARASALVPVRVDPATWSREFQSAHNRDFPPSRVSDTDVQALYTWLSQQR